MSELQFYKKYRLDDTVARQAGFNPYYPLISSGLEDPLMIGDQEYIDLASNNYLGLANDLRVRQAAKKGIERYGVSLCGTPVATGYSDLFRQAEVALSGFVQLEDCIIFPSCYQANNGLFPAITSPGDMVLIDRYAHSSLLEGVRAAGCSFRLFRHNDISHLEQLLVRHAQAGQVFVVTESVFSTEGSIAPFRQINELCAKYGAIPVVDDSHGIGVIGDQGQGILSQAGILDYQGIYTASLGKALATSGGMVAGKSSLIRYLRFRISHLIYSTAILPASLMALLEVLHIMHKEYQDLSDRMWTFADLLWEGLTRAGFILTRSETPILSVKSGNSLDTLKLAKWFYEHGMLTTPFIYPSVPEKEGRIRIIASANLRAESIDKALMQIESFKEVPV